MVLSDRALAQHASETLGSVPSTTKKKEKRTTNKKTPCFLLGMVAHAC
jgi:hypothetical protein